MKPVKEKFARVEKRNQNAVDVVGTVYRIAGKHGCTQQEIADELKMDIFNLNKRMEKEVRRSNGLIVKVKNTSRKDTKAKVLYMRGEQLSVHKARQRQIDQSNVRYQ